MGLSAYYWYAEATRLDCQQQACLSDMAFTGAELATVQTEQEDTISGDIWGQYTD